jgi:hypothetical protein
MWLRFEGRKIELLIGDIVRSFFLKYSTDCFFCHDAKPGLLTAEDKIVVTDGTIRGTVTLLPSTA